MNTDYDYLWDEPGPETPVVTIQWQPNSRDGDEVLTPDNHPGVSNEEAE
jgi:hypothetical protein